MYKNNEFQLTNSFHVQCCQCLRIISTISLCNQNGKGHRGTRFVKCSAYMKTIHFFRSWIQWTTNVNIFLWRARVRGAYRENICIHKLKCFGHCDTHVWKQTSFGRLILSPGSYCLEINSQKYAIICADHWLADDNRCKTFVLFEW